MIHCHCVKHARTRVSLTPIFPYMDKICPYAGKFGLEKTRIQAYFTQCVTAISGETFSISSKGSNKINYDLI